MSFREQPIFLISSPECSELCQHGDANCSFQVGWSINPHMKVGAVDPLLASMQHRHFVAALKEAGAQVIEVPFLHGEFDSVFVKDNAILFSTDEGRVALLAYPSTRERAAEQPFRKAALAEHGFDLVAEATEPLEGGDVIFLKGKRKLFFGFGQRSGLSAVPQLRELSGCDVIALELVDPFFFHLDTALNFVEVNGRQIAFAYRGAFSEESWRRLICDPDIATVVEVDRDEALGFAMNWIEVSGTVVLGSNVTKVVALLRSLGKTVVVTPLDQFQLAGGSAACLATEIHISDSILADPATLIQERISSILQLDS